MGRVVRVVLRGVWSRLPDSNRRPPLYESGALPTELRRRMARMMGLEPTTFGETVRRSSQLSYIPTSGVIHYNILSGAMSSSVLAWGRSRSHAFLWVRNGLSVATSGKGRGQYVDPTGQFVVYACSCTEERRKPCQTLTRAIRSRIATGCWQRRYARLQQRT